MSETKYKYFKIKIEGELTIQCKKEEDIESMVFHDINENYEHIVKIKEIKEISEEEAYE